MTSNLIQNYIVNKPAGAKQSTGENKSPRKKPAPYFDIQHELNNKTFIKPLEGKGRLLNGNIFNAPAMMVKDVIYDAKAFKHAAKGEANDHELGKLNDVGLMLGGLAIAGYLASKKQTPMTKGMEFIGLGSFLASMAIWPKIAIQLPAYLIHGVNVQKEYEDSFGRKKPFYQDPQFIPCDLYSDKEIDKIGDRLGVPKNIPNRRDFIQEKMRKIAIQNNTLWMLTAGFATPIMSALICNQLEKPLAAFLDARKNKKADNILKHFDKYAKKYNSHSTEKKLAGIIEVYKDKPVTPELERLIQDTLTEGFDFVTEQNITKDLKKTFRLNRMYTINEKTSKIICENLRKQFNGKNYSEEFLNVILPKKEDMIRIMNNAELFNKQIPFKDLPKIDYNIITFISEKVAEYNKKVPADKQEDISLIKKILFSTTEKNHPTAKVRPQMIVNTLNEALQVKLKTVAKAFDDFKAKHNALNKYAVLKIGSAPETVIANYWNNTADDMLKILGLTPKEIEKGRLHRNVMGKILREKIEHIVSDDKTYKKVINEIVKKIAVINEKIKSKDLTNSMLSKASTSNKYDELIDDIFGKFAKKLKESNIEFIKTSEAICVTDERYSGGTLKQLQKTFVRDRLLGVKSSFYRIINTLDFYRRVATNANGIKGLENNPKEIKEELVELCKRMTIQGRSSDNTTKFYMLRNPNPSTKDAPLEVKDGKVVNEFFGHAAETTDIPGDKYFYQNAMTMMFDGEMHKDTLDALSTSSIKNEVKTYRQLILDKIGGEYYFAKPYHLIRDQNRTSSKIKFLLNGVPLDEFFYKTGQQAYNTRKWTKIFGGFGAGLLGVTVLAQFFFGKMKNPEVTNGVKND